MNRSLVLWSLLPLVMGCGSETEKDKALSPSSHPYVFEQDGKYGYRDSSNILIPAKYDFAYEFDTCLVTGVLDSTGWTIIDREGNYVLTPVVYDNGPDYFEEGLARFAENGKMGFFNARGKKVIPATYDWATPFRDGLAAVCNGCREVPLDHERMQIDGGSWGMIDPAGKTVLPMIYEKLIHFEKDSVTVMKENKWFKMHIRNLGAVPIQGPK